VTDRLEKLRHAILQTVRIVGSRMQDRWVSAATIADRIRDDDGCGVESDAQAGQLLDELIAWGLLEEDQNENLAAAKRQFRHRRFRLSKKGRALEMAEIDPVPGVWDERLEA
jgi:hypothetical protein